MISSISQLAAQEGVGKRGFRACDEPLDDGVGTVAGFVVHAGVPARAARPEKLEPLRRCVSRAVPAEQRLPLTSNGDAS